MFIGILLILTWLVLLLRYPAKALPISMAALLGLGLVGLWVVWLDNREASQLARLELRLDYAPDACPADRPLRVQIKNANRVPLVELRWRVAAYAPGDLQPEASWHDCLPLPPLRSGYRPQTLEFRAEHLQGGFAN